jgi:hypothetical protein
VVAAADAADQLTNHKNAQIVPRARDRRRIASQYAVRFENDSMFLVAEPESRCDVVLSDSTTREDASTAMRTVKICRDF